VSFSDLVIMTNIAEKKLDQMMQGLLSKKIILQVDRDSRIFMHASSFQKLRQELLNHLSTYHQVNPLKAGMQREELKTKIPRNLNPKLFSLLMNQMIKDGEIAAEEETVRLANHKIALGADQADIQKKIIRAYRQSGLQPPYFKELNKQLDADQSHAKDVLMLLVEKGKLIKVKEDLFFDAGAVKNLQNRLVEFLTAQGEISTPQFKEMTGASRKFVIPLIEYFDARNVTIRIGDIRKLRKSS
jgi:selenocysteine-specific elongation factor